MSGWAASMSALANFLYVLDLFVEIVCHPLPIQLLCSAPLPTSTRRQETDEPTHVAGGGRTSPAPALSSTTTLRRRPSHRRQSSVAAISWSRFDPNNPSSRRDSNASWMRDGELDYDMSTRTGRSAVSRPFSWGPVGEFYYRESLCLSETDRSLFSHHECTVWCRGTTTALTFS